MNLLLGRTQKSSAIFTLVPLKIGSGVTFSLLAELELDEEETTLINKYKFANAPIVVSSFFEDVKRGFKSALLLGVLVFVLLFIPLGVASAGNITILTIAIMTVVYYRELREQILVSHLLNGGRTFRCDSIVELIQKEAYLEHVSQYLRQLLESAKHWDEREIVPIKPLRKEEAKKAVLKAFHG